MKNLQQLALALFVALLATACNENENNNEPEKITEKTYHITAKFDNDDASVFMAPAHSLSTGSLSFEGNGYALNPVRSARVFTDNLGWIYVFNYGGGYLQKFSYWNGSYTKEKELDVAPVMGGNAYVRPWKINEETILIHNINTADIDATHPLYQEYTSKGISKIGMMYVTRVEIPKVAISDILDTWTVPITEWDEQENAYVFRIDAPTVLNDKIYYGVGRRQLGETELTGMHTIVLDYPSLENPTYIRTTLADGNTNGYRGANMHAIDGYVYQANANEPATIVRLKDGKYDPEWIFKISEILGEEFATNNWYHAGNGICYMAANFSNATDPNNTWGVVRIDLNQKTAVKMNVPMSNLRGYQHGVVENGKFHMAISPVGDTGTSAPFVYEFNISSSSPDAFTKGLALDSGNIFVEGIF